MRDMFDTEDLSEDRLMLMCLFSKKEVRSSWTYNRDVRDRSTLKREGTTFIEGKEGVIQDLKGQKSYLTGSQNAR